MFHSFSNVVKLLTEVDARWLQVGRSADRSASLQEEETLNARFASEREGSFVA